MIKLDNFKLDWVLIDKLALGKIPTNKEHLEILLKNGIKSILSLCDENESDKNIDLSIDFYHERLILPDHKYEKLIELEQLQSALDILKKLNKSGPTFVHCIASIERSPLVCMAWLVKEFNYEPITALEYIMSIHKETNPLPGQLSLLKKL